MFVSNEDKIGNGASHIAMKDAVAKAAQKKGLMSRVAAKVGVGVAVVTAGLSSAMAAVVDTTAMDAHVAGVQSDITTLAGYGITIILSIMAVVIVYSLLKRGK
ncbi:hypothetical protein [Thiomicrorhabdus sp.]|uniref:hypothetical protein n=1 Tax=Thiomicrorhabdus sp. TaxID=2039724 RepID=UPI0029C6765D|nr:hypothetical protein [Thiomicrorhabdus sp.]